MIVVVSEGHEIARGDIIGFKSLEQLRLTPGSRVVRHLPSGGQEPLNYPQVDRYILQSGEKITRRLRETAVFACLT